MMTPTGDNEDNDDDDNCNLDIPIMTMTIYTYMIQVKKEELNYFSCSVNQFLPFKTFISLTLVKY